MYDAANIANHFYTLPFLRQACTREFEDQLEFHIASKKIKFIDPQTGMVTHYLIFPPIDIMNLLDNTELTLRCRLRRRQSRMESNWNSSFSTSFPSCRRKLLHSRRHLQFCLCRAKTSFRRSRMPRVLHQTRRKPVVAICATKACASSRLPVLKSMSPMACWSN